MSADAPLGLRWNVGHEPGDRGVVLPGQKLGLTERGLHIGGRFVEQGLQSVLRHRLSFGDDLVPDLAEVRPH